MNILNKQTVFRTVVSVALIVILLYAMRGNYGQVMNAIKNADPFFLALGFLAFILALIVSSLRFKMIVDAQETIPATFKEITSLTFIGYFFNNFLPTSIGGDVAKAYYLSRKTPEKIGSFTSVFIDRAIGLFTMIIMAAAALIFAQSRIVDDRVRYAIYFITLCSLVSVFFIFNKRFAKKFEGLLSLLGPFENKMRKLYNSIHVYKHHTELMAKSLAISVVSQVLFFVSIGMLAISIKAPIPPMEILLRMPIICAVSLLPSINGLGVREGSTVVFFGPIIGKENAFVVSVLWLLILSIVSVMGGLIYALSPQFKIKWGEIKEDPAV